MTTTLTREALLDKTKLVYKEVDVPGFGRVGIRQQSEMKRMARTNQLFDKDGNVSDFHNDRRRAYLLVDQLMIDDQTPMFSEGDVEQLMEQGSDHFDMLVAAIKLFNNEIEPEKNESGESEDTNAS